MAQVRRPRAAIAAAVAVVLITVGAGCGEGTDEKKGKGAKATAPTGADLRAARAGIKVKATDAAGNATAKRVAIVLVP
jgi:hypothetical protein